jgi:hypothetical protein
MMLPLQYQGEGQFTAPRGFKALCDKDLVIGETLRWEICHERSAKSHAHYFAVIGDAWANLPEGLAMDFPSAEHLRKHALIKAGYCTMTRIVCRTNEDAVAACALMKGMDGYSICDVSGTVVTVYQAQSQSRRAMGAKVFQESKDKVIAVISEIIGADATQAGEAA